MVDTCFSLELKQNYQECIKKFMDSYLYLDIPVTPKIHAVFYHVPDFCTKYEHGLEYYAEQAMEATHHDFNETWLKFKVAETNENYAPALLRAVCAYNASHL